MQVHRQSDPYMRASIHPYIHTSTHTYIHTYNTCIYKYAYVRAKGTPIPTYPPTYLPTYIHTHRGGGERERERERETDRDWQADSKVHKCTSLNIYIYILIDRPVGHDVSKTLPRDKHGNPIKYFCRLLICVEYANQHYVQHLLHSCQTTLVTKPQGNAPLAHPPTLTDCHRLLFPVHISVVLNATYIRRVTGRAGRHKPLAK